MVLQVHVLCWPNMMLILAGAETGAMQLLLMLPAAHCEPQADCCINSQHRKCLAAKQQASLPNAITNRCAEPLTILISLIKQSCCSRHSLGRCISRRQASPNFFNRQCIWLMISA